MRGWRAKLLCMLIVYFAGFSTAIYALAPERDNGQAFNSESEIVTGPEASAVRTEKLAQVANAGFKKLLSFAEEKAIVAGKFVKIKLAEQRQRSGN